MSDLKSPRIGFVGCGHHASHNLYPALRYTDCELVAACDLWENNRHLAKRAFGAQRVYEGFEPMFDAETLDGVIVCGPPALHYAATKAALERGLPVLVEKPPAENLPQMLELRELARQKKVVLMVAFMKRFARYYRQAKAIASTPEFGASTHLLLRYSYNMGSTAEHTLGAMAIHPIDLMRHFMGDPCQVQVLRSTWQTNHISFVLQFAFPNGAAASLVLNATAPAPMERLELTGEGAMVTVNELNELLHFLPQEGAWVPPTALRQAPNTTLQTFDNSSSELQGYAGEVAAFIESIKSGTPPAIATVDDAVAAMRLISIIAEIPRGESRDLSNLTA